MKITIEDSFIFSLIRWEYLANNSSSIALVNEYPLLEMVKSGCGFCELNINNHCSTCMLFKDGVCNKDRDNSMPYWIWRNRSTKENAKVIYDYLLRKADEYETNSNKHV